MPQSTLRCKGRTLCTLTAISIITASTLFTRTAQKPSSARLCPSLSAYPGFLCRTFTDVLSSSLRLHILVFHVLNRSISEQALSRVFLGTVHFFAEMHRPQLRKLVCNCSLCLFVKYVNLVSIQRKLNCIACSCLCCRLNSCCHVSALIIKV